MRVWLKINVLAFVCLLGALSPVSGVEKPSLAGRMLVAAPKLGDPFFRYAVVYLITHDRSGAVGVIVNRRMGEGSLKDLVGEMGFEMPGDRQVALYFGGPVAMRNVFVLHTADFRAKGTVGPPGGLAMTGDKSIIEALAEGQGPAQTRMMMGYAGWGAGQLESEIERGDWFDAPADENLIFENDGDAEQIWRRARVKAGLTL